MIHQELNGETNTSGNKKRIYIGNPHRVNFFAVAPNEIVQKGSATFLASLPAVMHNLDTIHLVKKSYIRATPLSFQSLCAIQTFPQRCLVQRRRWSGHRWSLLHVLSWHGLTSCFWQCCLLVLPSWHGLTFCCWQCCLLAHPSSHGLDSCSWQCCLLVLPCPRDAMNKQTQETARTPHPNELQ